MSRIKIIILFGIIAVAILVVLLFATNPQEPTYTDGQEIPWAEAMSLIEECRVEGIMQTHALQVSLTLKTGLRLGSLEPKIDDVIEAVRKAEPQCGNISMATE